MKLRRSMFAVVLMGCLGLGAVPSRASLEISGALRVQGVADFYEPLSAHGAWVEIGAYGRCWHPAHVGPEWRPYCTGRWVWTDCGWYWASEEPWAWACYHYGEWVYDPALGWAWVPGAEWAPAWVEWRVGDAYLGWAPRPPRGGHLALASFVFVEASRIGEPVKPSSVIVNNPTLAAKTRLIGGVTHATRHFDGGPRQRVAINVGPGAGPLRKATGREVQVTPIREAMHLTPTPPTAGRPVSGSRAVQNPMPPRSSPVPPPPLKGKAPEKHKEKDNGRNRD